MSLLGFSLEFLLATAPIATDETPLRSVESASVATVDAAPDRAPDRAWIRHTLRGHESLGTLAERYGVDIDELRTWNELAEGKDPKPGTTLRIHATRLPPPVQKRKTKVRDKESWADVAQRVGVTVDALRRWNQRFARRKRPPQGAALTLWVESGIRHYPLPPIGTPMPILDVPRGGTSVGRPDRGRIVDAVQLPVSDDYHRRFDGLSYGTTTTVGGVMTAFAAFRRETGYGREITIGAMSRKQGRRLRPHRSHQSGRDVDVRMPAMPHALHPAKLESHEVDWYAVFALLDAFARTGDVQVIFLERKFYNRLRKAGRRLGASDERIQFVLGHLKHAKGHTSHFHVRFECAATSVDCRDTE